MIQSGDPLREIIRYEEQLRTISQRIEVIILDNNPDEASTLKEMVREEEQLVGILLPQIKYLEVETTRLNPQSKKVYMSNVRFR